MTSRINKSRKSFMAEESKPNHTVKVFFPRSILKVVGKSDALKRRKIAI